MLIKCFLLASTVQYVVICIRCSLVALVFVELLCVEVPFPYTFSFEIVYFVEMLR